MFYHLMYHHCYILVCSHRPSSPVSPHRTQQNMQHAVLPHGDAGGVGKVDELPHHQGAGVAQCDLGCAALLEAAAEHGSEVRASGGQHQLVHLVQRNHRYNGSGEREAPQKDKKVLQVRCEVVEREHRRETSLEPSPKQTSD